MNDEDAAAEAAQMGTAREGFSSRPYLDRLAKPPVWTIGFGSTTGFDGHPIGPQSLPLSREQALALAALELHSAIARIGALVKVPLTTHMEAALADFIYNVGAEAFAHSTLLRLLNFGDYVGAAREFSKWTHAGGVELRGLVLRCAERQKLFLAPELATGTPVTENVTTVNTTPERERQLRLVGGSVGRPSPVTS